MTLTLDGYQAATADTAIYPGKGTPLGLIYCGLGLSEAGEVQGKLKKAIRDDGLFEVSADGLKCWFGHMKADRHAALLSELGDVLWYVAQTASELGYDLSDVAQHNLDKLADRKERGVLGGSGDAR